MPAAAPCRCLKGGEVGAQLSRILCKACRAELPMMAADRGHVAGVAATAMEQVATLWIVAQDAGRLAGIGTLHALIEGMDAAAGIGGQVG